MKSRRTKNDFIDDRLSAQKLNDSFSQLQMDR